MARREIHLRGVVAKAGIRQTKALRKPEIRRSRHAALLKVVAAVALLDGISATMARASTLTWDSDANPTNGATDGSGTWDTSTLEWYSASSDSAWSNSSNNTAVFGSGGTGGANPYMVTLGAPITIGGLTFNTSSTASGYTIAGGGNTLSFGANSTIQTNASATISATLGGAFTVTDAGAGTLTLTGSGSSIGALIDEGNIVIDTGGSVTATGTNQVGLNSTSGTMTIQGTGSFTSAGAFNIGSPSDNSTENGTLNLLGSGTFIETAGNSVTIGLYFRNGAGTVNQSGSTSTFSASGAGTQVTIGSNPGASSIATYNLGGGSFAANVLWVGYYGGSVGMFSQTAGTATDGSLIVGPQNNDLGIYTISGGTLNVNGTFNVGEGDSTSGHVAGDSSMGELYQSGGIVNASSAAPLIISRNNEGVGIYTITGGTLNSSSDIYIGEYGSVLGRATLNLTGTGSINMNSNKNLDIGGNSGFAGTATFNQNGGTLTFYSDAGSTVGGSGGLWLGNSTGSTATTIYNLNGGTAITPKVSSSLGTGGTSTFNFNGGTLKATAASTTFMQGLTAANVYGGGAVIDTNSVNITIAQPLLATTGNGVDSATLTAAGSNYVVAPTVTFSAPTSGTTATGYAVLNSSGQISSIVITNPGSGYTSAPTVTLSLTNLNGPTSYSLPGSGASATATANLNNAAGGLTKVGSGILTLSGASTYSGPTTVSAGTLQAGVASVAGVSGAFGNNSAVSLANFSGATLNITGFNTQIGSLTGGGSTGGNVVLGAATLTTGGDNTSPAAYAGVISGTGVLTKIGSGTQILSASNSYSGGTTVSGGTLQVSGSGTFGSVNSGLTLYSGGIADLNGTSQGVGAINGSGGTILNNGTGTNVTLTIGNGNATGGNYSGAIADNTSGSGTVAVTKVGTGTQIFSGANVYSGATTISAGIINYQNGTAFGTSSAITVASGATAQVQGGIAGGSQALSLSGTGAITNLGALDSVSGNNSYAGAITLAGATLISSDTAANTLTLTGGITNGGNLLTFQGAGNTTVSTTSITGTGGLTQTGSGTLTLTSPASSIGVITDEGTIVIDTGGNVTATGTNQVGFAGATGTLTIQGSGAFTSAGNFDLGYPTSGAASPGILNLTGTASFTENSGYGVNIGNTGGIKSATINQSGSSTFTSSSAITIANSNGTAVYNLSGGTFGSTAGLYLGQYGTSTGIFNQTGGTATDAVIQLGQTNMSLGIYDISAGTLNATNALTLGYTGGGTPNVAGTAAMGVFYQSGGIVNVSNGLSVGRDTATVGIYTMTAGTLNSISGGIALGQYGGTASSGTFNLTGTGTVNINSNNKLMIGDSGGGNNAVGSYAFNQNGGNLAFYNSSGVAGGTGGVYLGVSSSSTGAYTYNLNGGTVETPIVSSTLGTGGTSTFNFNGGTLKATTASTTFFQGLTAANVYGGGAVIDTNGVNITVAQPLLATTGNGVDSVTVTVAGSSYVVAPIVTFSSPASGTTAQGYAVLNASGQVGSIVITNPGTGYTSAPTVSLSLSNLNGSDNYSLAGSGATATATANLVNANGGLTKNGTGTLTLSAASTFAGLTTVNAGILRINGNDSAATGAVGVSAGAIGGTGTIGGAVTLSGTGGINLEDGAIGTLTLSSSLSITGATGANYLDFDLGTAANGTDKITVAGTTSVSNVAAVNLNQLSGAAINAGTYTLIAASNALSSSNFALNTAKAFGETYTLVVSGNNLNLQVAAGTAGPATAWWAGNTSVNWTDANWNTTQTSGIATSPTTPGYSTNVDFYTTTPAAGNLSTTLNADQDINSLTFASPSAGATTNVSIGGSNTLTIEAGTAGGNTAGHGITINTLNSGTVTDTISANVGIASSQTWTVNTNATLAVSGNITDFGAQNALTKAGAGVLTLSGANSYSGGTTISAGVVLANSTDTVSGSTGTGLVTLASGATLGGTGQIRGSVTVNGTITAGSSATIGSPGTLTINAPGTTTTFAGGGAYSAKISAATGTPGTTWDEVVMNALSVTATGATGATQFNIAPVAALTGLSQSTSYAWDIGDISGAAAFNNGLTNAIPTNTNLFGSSTSAPFALSTSGFTATLTGGASAGISPSQFSLELVSDGSGGDYLQLGYTSAPEPGTAMLALAGSLPMLLARRRRHGRSDGMRDT